MQSCKIPYCSYTWFQKNKRHSLIQTVKNFNIQQRNLADKQVKYQSHVRWYVTNPVWSALLINFQKDFGSCIKYVHVCSLYVLIICYFLLVITDFKKENKSCTQKGGGVVFKHRSIQPKLKWACLKFIWWKLYSIDCLKGLNKNVISFE